MEPVQRIIIGNNVYDVNDDELEKEVTEYLDSLTQKQKIAKEGKEAIITATQNRTGKSITTKTYAEIVDKIEKIRAGTFNVQDLQFRGIFEPYPNTIFTQILDNKIARFSNWDEQVPVAPGNVAFHAPFNRTTIHIPPNYTEAMTFSMQVNLDFSNVTADLTPIFSVSRDRWSDYAIVLAKINNTTLKLKGLNSSYDTISVQDMSNFNYFGVDIKCLENEDKITINMYAGTRQSDETSMSGYIPASKVLLFSRTYDSEFAYYVLYKAYQVNISASGHEYDIDGATTYAPTAVHFNDVGFRFIDPYNTSVFGNTNFLDMEVTS